MNRPTTPFRIGHGFDAHRFKAAPPLLLGGVSIDSPGLEGFSDADVLAHAVTDAVLGAAGLGDMGKHFPPGDPRFKDADSLAMLTQAAKLAEAKCVFPVQVDAILYLEKPKVAPYIESMNRNLAEALNLETGLVNVKATTTEGMGWIGRGEGAGASAVVLAMVQS